MKRSLTLLFLLLLSILSAYSQTEIWGVKEMAGKADGGILFKIDSLSQQIEIKHRFTDYSQEYGGQALVPLSNPNQYLALIGNEIVKIDVESDEIDRKFIFPNYTKNLVLAPDQFVYYVTWDSLVKINPDDLSVSKRGFNFINWPISVNPYDDNKLVVWASGRQLSYLNLESLELENLYEIPDYDVMGTAAFDQYKMYFLASTKENNLMKMIIFSYDVIANSYTEEYAFVNDSLNFQWGIEWLSGMVSGSDHLLYGAGKVVPGEEHYQIFSFNTQTAEFQVLAPFPEEIGGGSVGYLSIQDEKIYSKTSSGADEGLGCIFSYDISLNQFEVLHVYDSLYHFETNSQLAMNSDGNIVGVQPQLNEVIERKIFVLGAENQEMDEVFTVSYESGPTAGYFPGDFVKDGNTIYGFTNKHIGGDQSEKAGVFYKYDIAENQYTKLFPISEIFENETSGHALFELDSEHIYGMTKGYDEYSYYRGFQFNLTSHEVDFISEKKMKVKEWIHETDHTLLGVEDGGSRIYRLHMDTDVIDTLYQYERGELSNPVLDKDMNLICNLNYEYGDSDSLFIIKYDFSNGSFQVLGEMNQFIEYLYGEPESVSLGFKYVYNAHDDEKLIGDFWQYENHGWKRTHHRLINLDLNTFEMKAFEAEGTIYNTSQYAFVNDYMNTGSVYAMNTKDHYHHTNWDCGYLRLIEPEYDSVYTIDQFEMETTWYEYDDGDEPVKFNLLKKFSQSNETGLVDLEEVHTQVFVSNQTLHIQSEQNIENAHIVLFDMSGRQVDEFNKRNLTEVSHPLNLKSGVYIVNIISENHNESHKILVE